MTDVMIDLETLGTRPGCVVLSIGAVAFDRTTGVELSAFYTTIDSDDSVAKELRIEPSAMLWWMDQERDAQAVFRTLHAYRFDLGIATAQFCDWWDQWADDRPVWAHGLTFDLPILEAALVAAGRRAPWDHRLARDTRTVYDLTGFDTKTIQREGTYHNALDDARHQVRCLCAALQSRAAKRAISVDDLIAATAEAISRGDLEGALAIVRSADGSSASSNDEVPHV